MPSIVLELISTAVSNFDSFDPFKPRQRNFLSSPIDLFIKKKLREEVGGGTDACAHFLAEEKPQTGYVVVADGFDGENLFPSLSNEREISSPGRCFISSARTFFLHCQNIFLYLFLFITG